MIHEISALGRHRQGGRVLVMKESILLEGDNQLKGKQSRLKWQDTMTSINEKGKCLPVVGQRTTLWIQEDL